MFGWFEIKSPLTAEQRRWTDERFDWLLNEFGDDRLRRQVVTPTDEFFPEAYAATEEGALTILDRLCGYLDVDRERLEFQLYKSAFADEVSFNPYLNRDYALGAYEEEGGKITIWLEQSRLPEPQSVIATLSHELGHVHLLADGRCDKSDLDHEPLTDLFTVFFGLGIFNANEAIREVTWSTGNLWGWRASKQGYLSMAEYAYALARYAYFRGERKPTWVRFLRKDIQALMRMELKHLIAGSIPPSDPAMTPAQSADAQADDIEPRNNPTNSPHLNNEHENDAVEDDNWDNDDQVDGSDEESAYAAGGNADEYFTQGSMHATDGEFELAIEAFSKSLQKNPRDWEAWLCQAQARSQLKQYVQAAEDFAQSIRLHPANNDARLGRADANLWLKRYFEAIQDIHGMGRLNVRDSSTHLLLGLAYFGLKEYRRAKRCLDLSLRYDGRWARYYLVRSEIYKALGKSKRAENDLIEAICREPSLNDLTVRESWLAAMPLFNS